jgi:SpoVK/Ycf46/Vps4 family AAA+-type ATPase
MNELNLNNKWSEYLSNIDSQLYNMWNFILYKEFINKEISDLVEINNKLKEENLLLSLKRKIECCDEEKNKTSQYKKLKIGNLLNNEYTSLFKNKKYKFISQEKKKEIAKKIYNTLNSIDDIIKLKNHPNKFDFINDTKYTKLYNIIPTLETLQQIIGMKNVKEKLFNSICYFLQSMNTQDEMNHVMCMGPPGVGKTTIAKIIGDLYLKLGFLHNDTFIVAKRSDLIGKYLGQTAIKTQEIIDKALGGVLFIDEVYSLGNSDNKDSYAKECIDTINLNMSRTDMPWLLIVGGYKTEIEKDFLSYNKGLERRFTVKLEINEYSAEELFNILMKFIKDENWKMEPNAITIEDFKSNYKNFKYFAGDMRKLLQLAKENSSLRTMKEEITLDTSRLLIRDDFIKSLTNFKTNEITYYSMYT